MALFRVKSAEAGQRADVFVTSKYPEFSRSALDLLFDKKLVSMSGEPIKASQKVKQNQQIRVDETILRQVPKPIYRRQLDDQYKLNERVADEFVR